MNVILRRLAPLASTILLVLGGLALAAPAEATVTSDGVIINAAAGCAWEFKEAAPPAVPLRSRATAREARPPRPQRWI